MGRISGTKWVRISGTRIFLLFRSDLNLRFPDPSLTGWQFLGAVLTMLYLLYRAPDTRISFTAFFFVALMFGMLRHSGAKLAVLGSVSLVSFALVIWSRYVSNGDSEMHGQRIRRRAAKTGKVKASVEWKAREELAHSSIAPLL